MKHIKVLFDASNLIEGIEAKEGNRSGIFWVTYNILKKFACSPIYNVTIFFQNKVIFNKKDELQYFLSKFPYYSNNKQKYFINIDVHLNYIKNVHKLFDIIIRLLKVIKNVILLLLNLLYYSFIKRISNFDVFFSPVFSQPEELLNNSNSIKIFQILYDCIPVLDHVSYPLMNEDHWFNKLKRNLNKNTYYFCISENTKKDFLKTASMQLDKDKMFVTYIAPSQIFIPNYNKIQLDRILLKYNIIKNPNDCYIFSFCNIDPRKNLLFTVKCFLKFIEKNKINDMYFYLGGGYFKPYIKQFLQEISIINNSNKIILLGYIDDSDVNILYSNSLFFVYLSQYEGFGLPPLEAMQAGTPVISSNNSSLPEVVGDAAITINYNDEFACIRAFEDLYYNKDLRKEYINKGFEQAKKFSWERTFDMISKQIIEAVNDKSKKLYNFDNNISKEELLNNEKNLIDQKQNYKIITELLIPNDRNMLLENSHDIIYFNVRNDKITLRCGFSDPQFYLLLPIQMEKPEGDQFIEIIYSNEIQGILQIYYDYGSGLDEQNSFSNTIFSKTKNKKIIFPIIGWNNKMKLIGIRIDPPYCTKFTLFNIRILASWC